jgi:hypothetical protein
MYEPIFETASEIAYDKYYLMLKKEIETSRERALSKLTRLCPNLEAETFGLMFANAWHENYKGIRSLACALDIYKGDIFALEGDEENFAYTLQQESYLKFDGDY